MVAFLAGILSILSPCILPTLPAFFANTFKEKRRITKMTFIFFLGFALVFDLMGMLAAYLGKSIVSFQNDITTVIRLAGLFLIGFGIMTVFGKGFALFPGFGKKFDNDVPGVFLMGNAFALGWSACLGPIIFGILSIASVLNNYAHAGALLFLYSLGLFLPLFVLSLLYDKYDLSKNKFIRGVEFKFGVLGKTFELNSTKTLSGILLACLGVIFLFFGSTEIVNSFDMFGLKPLFYEWQRALLSSGLILNLFGLAALAIFILLLARFLIRKNKRP
jgi:cytochrome c-type biogenesis protein